MPPEHLSTLVYLSRESILLVLIPKRGRMEDSLVELLAWIFVKTEEEILVEAEVAALRSMLLAEDPRPERAGNNG
jgi:hypothetical protein